MIKITSAPRLRATAQPPPASRHCVISLTCASLSHAGAFLACSYQKFLDVELYTCSTIEAFQCVVELSCMLLIQQRLHSLLYRSLLRTPGSARSHTQAQAQMRLRNLALACSSYYLTILNLVEPATAFSKPQWPKPFSLMDREGVNLKERDDNFRRQFNDNPPVAVRKMSTDTSEMFFQEYWGFSDPLSIESSTFSKEADADTSTNSSLLLDTCLQPPLLPHSSSTPPLLLRALQKRDFTCPTGTNSCASIGAAYGCCPQGTTCQLSGSGELGCCPGSQASCSGSTPTQCEDGYSPCPQFHGGSGCCLAGFTCQSDGCKCSPFQTSREQRGANTHPQALRHSPPSSSSPPWSP